MKNLSSINRRKISLVLVLLPLFITFVYVGLRSGPLAPVTVTVARVEVGEITPSLFGIGTVEARYTHKIGPTIAGRVKSLSVDIGDSVKEGQILGEMDSVDLINRSASQAANIRRANAALLQAETRSNYAKDEALRAEKLFPAGAISKSTLDSKRTELHIAEAALIAAKEEIQRIQSDHDAIARQLENARLVSPTDGIVVLRNAEVGTTVIAGQTILEVIDPKTLWINARFDQISSSGLRGDLSAKIVLRSKDGVTLSGRVLYIEPKADPVTEEMLAKIVFDVIPKPLPPLGELAEVTVTLPSLPRSPIVPNAAIQHIDGKTGVWEIKDRKLSLSSVVLGSSDLDGNVQVREGLKGGEDIVVYSEKALSIRSRIHVADTITQGVRQ